MSPKDEIISSERIEKSIFLIRGQRVMLDADLADLYGVQIKRLNEQVRRNSRRFPADFLIRLTKDEDEALRSQFAILKPGRGEHPKLLSPERVRTGQLAWTGAEEDDRCRRGNEVQPI